jgi:hypothetical protein
MCKAGVLCVTLAILGADARAAQDRSQVAVEDAGKRIELRHVVGARYSPASGEAEIRLLFASADPAGVVLADTFGGDQVTQWVAKSGASAVRVTFPEANPEQYQIGYFNVNGRNVTGGGTASGGATRGVFKTIDVAADRVSGELMFTFHEMGLSGAFAARLPSVKEAAGITGAAVGKSAQAQALLAFARALAKQDLKAAQAYAAGDVMSELEELKKTVGAAAVKEIVQEQFGDLALLQRRLGSAEAMLRESGDTAVISLTKKTKDQHGESTETQTFRFLREDGKWKVHM